MDLIAHFWERLPQTPPLARADLHLVAAIPAPADGGNFEGIDISRLDDFMAGVAGVMLYVPKAYRADVLAADAGVAALFAGYIQQVGAGGGASGGGVLPAGVWDVSGVKGQGGGGGEGSGNGRCAIDFITGEADTVGAMVPHLLPAVHKKAPARQVVNVMMQLPGEVAAASDAAVRPATEEDLPALNRWRRLYKEERGILFDADMDAWVQTQRVFVLEVEGHVAALAKFDLELAGLIEIGGVYTFPEFRNQGLAHRIMGDLAARVRAAGKAPTLQVDETNAVARDLYLKMGWKVLGRLARVWLTAG
jgi:GNAT superfamily N-acetyltransferase